LLSVSQATKAFHDQDHLDDSSSALALFIPLSRTTIKPKSSWLRVIRALCFRKRSDVLSLANKLAARALRPCEYWQIITAFYERNALLIQQQIY
jgi:hypothetical protein